MHQKVRLDVDESDESFARKQRRYGIEYFPRLLFVDDSQILVSHQPSQDEATLNFGVMSGRPFVRLSVRPAVCIRIAFLNFFECTSSD